MNTNKESWKKDSQEKKQSTVFRKAQTAYGWKHFVSILRIGRDLLRY